MKKLYYKTSGEEPHVACLDLCPYKFSPTVDTKIGSVMCRECQYCYGWDSEKDWIKCLNYDMEQNGLHVERKDTNHV